jgi:hypothetical protein
VQHRPALARFHEPLEFLGHARDLAVQPSDVAYGSRELYPRLTQTSPQVLYPEVPRCDLDHLAWVRLLVELRRIGAKCRGNGG